MSDNGALPGDRRTSFVGYFWPTGDGWMLEFEELDEVIRCGDWDQLVTAARAALSRTAQVPPATLTLVLRPGHLPT